MDDDLRQRILERVRDTLEEMHQRAEALKGEHSIPATELFSPRFMRENTDFDSFEAFVRAGDFEVGEGNNIEEAVSDEALNQHVDSMTPYNRWEEMKEDATEAWALDQLKGNDD